MAEAKSDGKEHNLKYFRSVLDDYKYFTDICTLLKKLSDE